MFKNKKIMFVVAHPDDEVLGCGGMITRLVSSEGATVKVVILGEGITSRTSSRSDKSNKLKLKKHNECITKAKKILGYQELSVYNLPDNRFDSVDLLEIVKIIEAEKNDFKPSYVFTHHGGDLNIDHRLTFQAVLTSTRPVPGEQVQGIFTFSTLSSTEWAFDLDSQSFIPNLFCPLDNKNIKAKIKAMDQYEFEKRPFPHPRSSESITSQAKIIGSNVGYKFAEAFRVVRLNYANVR